MLNREILWQNRNQQTMMARFKRGAVLSLSALVGSTLGLVTSVILASSLVTTPANAAPAHIQVAPVIYTNTHA
jgi:putative flippase GtrA